VTQSAGSGDVVTFKTPKDNIAADGPGLDDALGLRYLQSATQRFGSDISSRPNNPHWCVNDIDVNWPPDVLDKNAAQIRLNLQACVFRNQNLVINFRPFRAGQFVHNVSGKPELVDSRLRINLNIL